MNWKDSGERSTDVVPKQARTSLATIWRSRALSANRAWLEATEDDLAQISRKKFLRQARWNGV
jgi:hypothetical protein